MVADNVDHQLMVTQLESLHDAAVEDDADAADAAAEMRLKSGDEIAAGNPRVPPRPARSPADDRDHYVRVMKIDGNIGNNLHDVPARRRTSRQLATREPGCRNGPRPVPPVAARGRAY